MSTKTKFSKDDFSKILANYDLGEYRGSRYFTHGLVQTTILLRTAKGKFVLRYYENRTEKHVLFEVKLMTHLRKKKFPVPALIRNSSGRILGKYRGKPYVITEYINGEITQTPNDISKYKNLSEVVKITAKLHNITKSHRLGYFGDHKIYNADYCWDEYKRRSKNVRNINREKWLKNELNKLKFPNFLPKGICHCDVNYSNFLFEKGKVVCVLDFDMSCYTYLIYDIASLIYWWAFPPKKYLNVDEARRIIGEYCEYRKLSKFEKIHIYDALKLIILLGISWSEEDDFEQEKRRIAYLDSMDRDGFYKKLFS